MPTLKELIFGTSPSNGGLSVTNYPNPYGLRAYKNQDGSYGGQMMPKYTGWLGPIENLANKGDISTELSLEDDIGPFPSMVPTLTKNQLKRLLSLPDGKTPDKDIIEAAEKFANERRKSGLSPFKDIWDEK